MTALLAGILDLAVLIYKQQFGAPHHFLNTISAMAPAAAIQSHTGIELKSKPLEDWPGITIVVGPALLLAA